MALSNDLISQFVKATQDSTKTSTETTAYGKIIVSNGVEYVQLDGSDLLTPISSTTVVNDGDRVIVTVKNHTATVTGDLTNPSASNKEVQEIGNKISEFEIVIADKVTTEQLEAEIARIEKLRTEELEVTNAKIETLNGKVAEIDTIKADVIEVEDKVTANEADVKTLRADIADFKDVTAEEIDAIKGNFNTLNSDYADFKVTTTDKLTANEASITDLETKKLDTETANAKYATIDFSNIGEAAIEKLFSDSGIIKDLIMSDGKVTGELVGVTIKGDLIEGNTVKADKLVIQGEDGLYYKLNVNALGEATASSDEKYQNGLDGSNIIAESITAEKIAVNDLVAFGATIGGFNITNNSIYSGVKESVSNTTRGIYLDNEGRVNIGDSNNYLKFYVDEDGTYKLELQANSIKFGASGTSLEETIENIEYNAISYTRVEYYLSTSNTTLEGGSWQTTAPEWVDGMYMWSRTEIVYMDGYTYYTPSEDGTCIAGATGADGADAEKPEVTKIVEGTELVIDDGKQITEFKIYGDSKQNTRDGKNIFNKAAKPDYIKNVTISELENGIRITNSESSGFPNAYFVLSDISNYVGKTLRIKCDFTSSVSADCIYYGIYYIKENLLGASSISGISRVSGKEMSALIIDNSTYKYIGIGFSLSYASSSIPINEYADFTNIIVTVDNDDMTYEDYGISPSPEYPSEIKNIGTYNSETTKYDINLIIQNSSNITFPISLNEPLRGFQNGIKDEALIKDNSIILTKNIKELIITSDETTSVTIDDMVSDGQFMSSVGGSISGKTITFDGTVTDATIIYETTEPVIEEIGTIEDIPMDKDSINTYYIDDSLTPNIACKYYTVYAGLDGKDGVDGERIVSITSEFYLSTSKETLTGGEWTTIAPTWSSDMYVWTRSKIEYSNPTNIEYTEPLCDSSWEAVNEIEIGGRNLFLKTSVEYTNNTYNIATYNPANEPLVAGEIYTASICVTPAENVKSFKLYFSSGNSFAASFYVSGTDKQIISETFTMSYANEKTPDDGIQYANAQIYRFPNDGTVTAESTVHWFKIEKGNKATDWTPAPEDLEQSIADKSDEIYKEILDQRTDILATTESLILQAATDYVGTGDFEAYKETVEAALQIMSNDITMKFTTTSNDINNLKTSTSDFETTVKKYFQFSEDGLVIGDDTSAIKLTVDNDEGIIFSKNGETFGYWDGNDFYTGNIKVRVNERAQFGNYAYIPRSDGSLTFLRVD